MNDLKLNPLVTRSATTTLNKLTQLLANPTVRTAAKEVLGIVLSVMVRKLVKKRTG
ncbi:hypothetical protein U1701_00020 [Sphingomonas sp. PB2P19]|uniref:hypothetical protein n=1 Tax=Sphingomonas rhamnosi TaxID=3096156 RepID=UPI002FCC5006